MPPVPSILAQRIAKVEGLVTTYDQYKDWKAALIYTDGSVTFVKTASVIRTGDGVFGPATIYVDAGDWRPDGSSANGKATGAQLELNPACIAAVVDRTA